MKNIFVDRIKEYSSEKLAFTLLDNGIVSKTISYEELYDSYLEYKTLFENIKIENKLCVLYLKSCVDFVSILMALIDTDFKPILKTIGPSVAKEKVYSQLKEIKNEMKDISTVITNYNYDGLKDMSSSLSLNYIDLENKEVKINNNDDYYHVNGDIILLTSGSTKFSKGVLITVEQLEKNVLFCRNLWDINDKDICLDWMPHSHIYGLVTGFLLPVYTGGHSYIMSPKDYSNNFNMFFSCLGKYKITHTHTPASNMFLENGSLYGSDIDLSNLKTISLGGEAINYSLLDKFKNRHNLKRNIFSPNYGMSEITGLLCAIKYGEELKVLDVNEQDLKFNNKITVENKYNSCKLVSVGKTNKNETLICEPDTFDELGEYAIGEIVINVPSISNAYINPEDNISFVPYNGKIYYRTGDLGFKYDDYLTVVGRIKEIIKIDGKNISPYEIENCIMLSAYKKGITNVVAFARKKNITSEEIGLLIETTLDDSYIDKILKMIDDKLQIKINNENIILLRKGRIPRFSNGKISRKKCDEYFEILKENENE